MKTTNLPWVVFTLKDQLFAVSSQNVTAINKKIAITALPQMPKHIKGIIRYRDEIFRTYDARIIFSINSRDNESMEFADMMKAREHDHIRWLEELENSVKENRSFSLTTDPHECAFGKWYDNYQNDNNRIRKVLNKFETPHKKIHSIAQTIEEYKLNGDFKAANELIERTKSNELTLMINLFNEISDLYMQSLSIHMILLKKGDQKCAIEVDDVLAVEHIEPVKSDEVQDIMINRENLPANIKLAKRVNEEFVIMLSDSDFLEAVF